MKRWLIKWAAIPVMSDIERGKKNPSLRIVQAIADVHEIQLSKLLFLAENKYERGQRSS
jgi:hypothetical protein